MKESTLLEKKLSSLNDDFEAIFSVFNNLLSNTPEDKKKDIYEMLNTIRDYSNGPCKDIYQITIKYEQLITQITSLIDIFNKEISNTSKLNATDFGRYKTKIQSLISKINNAKSVQMNIIGNSLSNLRQITFRFNDHVSVTLPVSSIMRFNTSVFGQLFSLNIQDSFFDIDHDSKNIHIILDYIFNDYIDPSLDVQLVQSVFTSYSIDLPSSYVNQFIVPKIDTFNGMLSSTTVQSDNNTSSKTSKRKQKNNSNKVSTPISTPVSTPVSTPISTPILSPIDQEPKQTKQIVSKSKVNDTKMNLSEYILDPHFYIQINGKIDAKISDYILKKNLQTHIVENVKITDFILHESNPKYILGVKLNLQFYSFIIDYIDYLCVFPVLEKRISFSLKRLLYEFDLFNIPCDSVLQERLTQYIDFVNKQLTIEKSSKNCTSIPDSMLCDYSIETNISFVYIGGATYNISLSLLRKYVSVLFTELFRQQYKCLDSVIHINKDDKYHEIVVKLLNNQLNTDKDLKNVNLTELSEYCAFYKINVEFKVPETISNNNIVEQNHLDESSPPPPPAPVVAPAFAPAVVGTNVGTSVTMESRNVTMNIPRSPMASNKTTQYSSQNGQLNIKRPLIIYINSNYSTEFTEYVNSDDKICITLLAYCDNSQINRQDDKIVSVSLQLKYTNILEYYLKRATIEPQMLPSEQLDIKQLVYEFNLFSFPTNTIALNINGKKI